MDLRRSRALPIPAKINMAILNMILTLRWSPLGDKIAFCSTRSGADVDIWTVNPDGSGLTQLSNGLFDYGMGTGPEPCYLSWSPDGKMIAFTGDTVRGPYPDYVYNIYTINSDGSNANSPTQLTSCNASGTGWQTVCINPSWSPDGSNILLNDWDFQGDNIGGSGIYTVTPSGATPVSILLSPSNIFGFPHWSTDGQEVIFLSNQSGSWGIWSMSASGANPTQIPISSKQPPALDQIDCSRCGRFDKL
jgi:Tol biopolymer transport system component